MISKTKELNLLAKQLMQSYDYMKCANKSEFAQRLQWLSEGMLKNHINPAQSSHEIDRKELELYRDYCEKREKLRTA